MNHRITLERLLRDCITRPDRLPNGYAAFGGFSLRNQLFAIGQCVQRRLAPGPLATAAEWAARGVAVLCGERPLSLSRPRVYGNPHEPFAGLVFESQWFLECQTSAPASSSPARSLPAWSSAMALARLGVIRIACPSLGGAESGLSFGRFVAVDASADYPEKILLHELAHVRLGHSRETERRHRTNLVDEPEEVMAESVALLVAGALTLDGAFANGPAIKQALGDGRVAEADLFRVFGVADDILRAGRGEHPGAVRASSRRPGKPGLRRTR